MEMNQYPRVAQPGMAPQGMAPHYSAPQGPQYMAPQGMAPHYSAPQGMAPQYSAAQGMAPQGMGTYPGMMMQTPPKIIIPAGLPPGLAYLATLNEVKIHQILEIAEVICGCEMNNKYEICNSQGQKIMFAKEDTDFCTRQCCGNVRPFVMHVTDNFGQPLMLMSRPLRCQSSLLCCFFLQEMEIESPPGVLQGTVNQVWTPWIPKYRVYNTKDQCVFTIVGECCYCRCCSDIVFHVFNGDGEVNEVAQIVKHWGGCAEMFGAANDFTLRFMTDLDVMQKLLLFGATFLIDFNYFEERSHNSNMLD